VQTLGQGLDILRAGGWVYYDRPDGNTVFSIPGNPPLATARDHARKDQNACPVASPSQHRFLPL
jgi:hypothetical protein